MHHEIRTYLRRLAMEHIKPNYAELGRAFVSGQTSHAKNKRKIGE